jgi:HAD superfamily hydrolase (TIGR01509 family)
MPVDYPDLVIFDCDGTLVDTERISVRVNLQLLNEVGGDYTEAEVRELFVGASLETYATLVEQRLGKPLEADWIQRWSDMFRGICERELEAVDGVVDALDGIAATGVPLCVASNGMLHDVVRNLGQVGIHDRFDGRIFSATDVAVGKPAPDLFLHAAADFDTAPERCAVVEECRRRPGCTRGRHDGLRLRRWHDARRASHRRRHPRLRRHAPAARPHPRHLGDLRGTLAGPH